MKQNIQPKVKTGLKMSTTMKVVVAGGLLSLVLTIGFFLYSNLQHKEVLANGTEITSVATGNWGSASTWNLNRTPENGDIVVIPANRTVTVSNPIIFNGTIKVYGALLFTNGKLTMDNSSQVMIHENGSLVSAGPGMSDKLTIGSYVWQGSYITNVTAPNLLTGTGAVGGNPLPVTLISFDASKDGNAVKLQWETAMELNNESFTVERSTNGSDFNAIGEVLGAGTTSERQSYSFYDEKPLGGENYYRLKQNDLDGKFEYSKIIRHMNTVTSAIEVVNVGPNPFKQNFTVDFNGEADGELDVIISNATGAIVHREKIMVVAGRNKFSFSDNKNLPDGIYFITFQNNEQKFSSKLIKG